MVFPVKLWFSQVGKTMGFLSKTIVFIGKTMVFVGKTMVFLGQTMVFLGQTMGFLGQTMVFLGKTMVFLGKTMVFYASVPLPFVHPSVSSLLEHSTSSCFFVAIADTRLCASSAFERPRGGSEVRMFVSWCFHVIKQ